MACNVTKWEDRPEHKVWLLLLSLYYRTHTSISDPSSQIRIISPYLLEACACACMDIVHVCTFAYVCVCTMYMYYMYVQYTSYLVWHWLEFQLIILLLVEVSHVQPQWYIVPEISSEWQPCLCSILEYTIENSQYLFNSYNNILHCIMPYTVHCYRQRIKNYTVSGGAGKQLMTGLTCMYFYCLSDVHCTRKCKA